MAAAAALLSIVPAAPAAQELGDRCVGNDTEAGWTATVLNNNLSYPELPPVVPPEGAKVITRWKAQVGPGVAPLAQQLVAFKQVDEEEDLLVGESAVETLVEGTNEFATRIPVPEYGHIGLRGPVQTLFCDHESGHLAGVVESPWAVGETRHFKVELNMGVPAIAFVEPDRDGDGYGDETQDGCSINAAVQGPCPIVTLRNGIQEVRRNGVLVQAGANVNTQMRLSGSVSWRPPPRRNDAGKLVRQPKRTVRLDGGEQSVTANVGTLFWVPLPKAVTKRLRRMSPAQHLNAKLQLFVFGAPELEGRTTTKELNAKLPGQAKPGG